MKSQYIIVILMFTIFFLYFQQPESKTSYEINRNISEEMFDGINNMTEITTYSNLYKEEITARKVIHNIMNPIIYTITRQMNTIIPIAIHLADNGISKTIMKIIMIGTILYLIIAIPGIIKSIIAIHFFIKEKKRDKIKWYE